MSNKYNIVTRCIYKALISHVLPPRDGVVDWRQADLVFSRVGVCVLGDVVVAKPDGGSNVTVVAHVLDHPAAN